MKQYLINKINAFAFRLGVFTGRFKAKKQASEYTFFLPLATIGGVELVHLDIVKALQGKRIDTIFWHRFSPFISGAAALETIEHEYAKFSRTTVFEERLTSRFKEWQKSYEFGKIWSGINRKDHVVVLRNGDALFKSFIFKFALRLQCKLFIITHNAYAEFLNQDDLMKYLDLDFQEHIACRVLISDSLSQVIEDSRQKAGIAVPVPEKVIYNAVQTSAVVAEKDFSHLHILFAGRDVEEKRFYLIHEIAKTLADLPNITFHFAGPSQENYAEAPHMKFYGEVKDQQAMHALYTQCNVFVLLSKSEGFPRSIAEAMMTGSLIVTTDVGSIRDHISRANGLLIGHTDDAQIKEAVLDYLRTLLETRHAHEISAHNRAYALQHFSTDTFNEKYRQLFDALM